MYYELSSKGNIRFKLWLFFPSSLDITEILDQKGLQSTYTAGSPDRQFFRDIDFFRETDF